jgi:glycosyltransferase involved in cell wall biosynthesis
MRLAWFSPWPPQRTGVAGRSAAVTARLAAAGLAVDVFVDARDVPVARAAATPPRPGDVRVQSAHEFVWRQARGQYDLAVYQVGNSRLHEFLWPYLFRYSGLAVLHDARLHHARGRALLRAGRPRDYRAEFAFDQPAAGPEAAELAVHGFDGAYYYLWPMTRAVLAASRVVATHARGAVPALSADAPDTLVSYLPLGEGRDVPWSADERERARAQLGLAPGTLAFGVFGGLTAERRLPQILRAFARARRDSPGARLVLAGAPDAAVDLAGLAAALGVADAVIAPGVLDDPAFDDAIAAVDVCLSLRWPSSLETSGPWLRALAAGRPTIVTALPHQADVPALDPRDWQPTLPPVHGAPVTVAVDILDEDHSLVLAMRRLARDADLRARLGAAARQYWEREHREAVMQAGYERLLQLAAARPAPAASLPAHLRPDPLAHLGDLLSPFPEVSCTLR